MKRYFDLLFELCATAMQTCGYRGFADMRYPPNQPWVKTHAAQLAPLVTDAHLDQIEHAVKKALVTPEEPYTPPEPYKTRIEDQLLLWNVARLETQAIYKTMLATYRIRDVLADSATDAERLYVAAIIKQAIENIDNATELLLSAQERLRGNIIYRQAGSYQERLCSWLNKIENQRRTSPEKTAATQKHDS